MYPPLSPQAKTCDFEGEIREQQIKDYLKMKEEKGQRVEVRRSGLYVRGKFIGTVSFIEPEIIPNTAPGQLIKVKDLPGNATLGKSGRKIKRIGSRSGDEDERPACCCSACARLSQLLSSLRF